jgi:dATP/dGTP pyrophosphohydrolase
MDLYHHLQRQAAFSKATFGPGPRTKGVTDHIKKELDEIASANNAVERSKEWVDIVLLGLDGLLRSCREQSSGVNIGIANNREIAYHACRLIREKQEENEMREWPDWRLQSPDHAIEHFRIRSDDPAITGENDVCIAEARDENGTLKVWLAWVSDQPLIENLKSLVEFVTHFETSMTVTIFPENIKL